MRRWTRPLQPGLRDGVLPAELARLLSEAAPLRGLRPTGAQVDLLQGEFARGGPDYTVLDADVGRKNSSVLSQASDTHGVGRRGRRKRLALSATGSR